MKARRRNERSIQLHLQRLDELGHQPNQGGGIGLTAGCRRYCLLLLNAIVILVLGLHMLQTYEKQYRRSSVLFSGSNVTDGLEIDIDMFDDSTLIEQEVVEGGGNYLVIGSAFGVDDYHISIFCDSLRRVASSSTPVVVLFVNSPISVELRSRYKGAVSFYNVNVKDLPLRYHGFDSTSVKYVLFRRFLRERDRYLNFRFMWIFDVRDVYFQKDPFTLFQESQGEGLHVFQNGGFRSIGEYVTLSRALRNCFNQSIVETLNDKRAMNPGLFAGTTGSMLEFLDLMTGLLSGELVPGFSPDERRFPECETYRVDAAVLDVLVHSKILTPLIVHTEDSNKNVYVISLKSAKLFKKNVTVGTIHDLNNKLVQIVHEYAYDHNLHSKLIQDLSPFLRLPDPLTEWNKTVSCKSFNLVTGYDVFKDTCRLKMFPTISPAQCCSICLEIRGHNPCQAFYHEDGKCYLKHCETEQHYSRVIEGISNRAKRTPSVYTAYIPLKLDYVAGYKSLTTKRAYIRSRTVARSKHVNPTSPFSPAFETTSAPPMGELPRHHILSILNRKTN